MSTAESHKVPFGKKLKNLFSKKNIFIVFLIAVLGFQYWQSTNSSNDLSFLQTRDSSLIEEIGQLKETYLKVGEDMNEIRKYLMLPLKEYQELESVSEGEEDTDKNQDQVQLALFKYVDSIVSTESVRGKLSINKSFLDNLLISKDFSEFLIKEELAFSPTIRDENNVVLKITTKDGDPIVIYSLDNKTGELVFQTTTEKEDVESTDFMEFKQNLMQFLTDNKASLVAEFANIKKLQESISKAISSKTIQNILTEKELVLSPDPDQSDLKMTYSIFNKSNELVGEIVLGTDDPKIALVDKNNEELEVFVTDISTALPTFLNDLESRSIIEQKADDSIESFQKTLEDSGFKSLLAKGNLYFQGPTEKDDRIYYTLHDQQDKIVSTFVVEKATGVVTVTDDNHKDENLLFFDEDLKKKP